MLFQSLHRRTCGCVVFFSVGIVWAQAPKQEQCLTAAVTVTEKSGQFGSPFFDKLTSGAVIQFRFLTRITTLRDYSGPAGAAEAQKVIMRHFEISTVAIEKGPDSAIAFRAGRLAGFLWDYAAEAPDRPESDRFHVSGALVDESLVLKAEMNLSGSHRLFQTASPLLSPVAIPEATINTFTLSGRSLTQSEQVSDGNIAARISSLQTRSVPCGASGAGVKQ